MRLDVTSFPCCLFPLNVSEQVYQWVDPFCFRLIRACSQKRHTNISEGRTKVVSEVENETRVVEVVETRDRAATMSREIVTELLPVAT